MKLKQYQFGGIVYTPIDAASQQAASSQTASTAAGTASKVPGFAKEIVDLVKENGLTSDVGVFLKKVQNTLKLASDPTGENLTMKEILKIQNEANKVAQNYKSYQDATKNLDKEASWGDVATDDRGNIWVSDGSTIKKISIDTYYNNRENYLALTNSELLQYREASPNLAFDQKIIHDITASVGTGTIANYLKSLVSAIGSTELTGYTQKQAQQIRQGLDILMSGGPTGVYKYTEKSANGSDKESIDALVNYLYRALPNTYKNTLAAKAAVDGYSPDSDGTKQLLFETVAFNTDKKIAVDYDKQASEVAGYSNVASEEKLTDEDNYLVRISQGDYGPARRVTITNYEKTPGTHSSISTIGWDVGAMIGKNGETLPDSTLKYLIQNAWGIQAADTADITFGNKVLKSGEDGLIYWDGRSHLNVVQLPVTQNESGQIVPDFALVQKLDDLNKYAKNRTPLEVNDYISKNFDSNVVVKYNPDTKLYECKNSMTMPFVTFKAYANDKNIDLSDEDKLWLEKIAKGDGELILESYNNLVRYGEQHPSKSDKPYSIKAGKSGKFYAGNVFIPIKDPYQGWNVSGINQNYSKDTFTNVSAKMQLNSALQSYKENEIIDSWV